MKSRPSLMQDCGACLCLDSKCDGMRRDTAQVTGTVSCGQRWNLITSLPNLAPSLTVQAGVLACEEPETQNCGDVNTKASQYLIKSDLSGLRVGSDTSFSIIFSVG